METTNTISGSTLDRLGLYSACLLGCVLFVVAAYSLLESFAGTEISIFPESYVLPGCLLVLFVLAMPSLVLSAMRKFDFFHPLVYPVWSYLFPAFVIGSMYFATGKYEPHFIDLVTDREYHIPLALFYVAIGFAGLSLGFAVPGAKRWGNVLSEKLPVWEWDLDRIVMPAFVLLLIGRFFQLMAFSAGSIGYQYTDEPVALGITYYSFSLLGSLANLLLWMAVFKARKFQLRHFMVVSVLIVMIPYSMFVAGGRGELLRNVIAIFFAYIYSGKRLRFRHCAIAGILLSVAVLAGMVYGTYFRLAKGDESRIGMKENLALAISTFNEIRLSDITENLGFAADRAFERFETVTSLSVVVANYGRLKPFEEEYGVANNILTDTWTAFIPRFIWPEKPLISDARSLAALYFQFPDNSYAITPMGDLLRNFGPLGIPVGMAVLGIVLRVFYSALIEAKSENSWRSVCYFSVLVNISFEGFYGSIFPGLVRVGIVLFVGILFLNFAMRYSNPAH